MRWLGLLFALSLACGRVDYTPRRHDASDAARDAPVDRADDADAETDADADAETDADADAEADADTDAETDADTDAETDAEPDACGSAVEECNGLDDDCDGETDEDFDLEWDRENCGGCDIDCSHWNACLGYACGPNDGIAQITTGGAHTCAVTFDGRVYCWGSNALGQLGRGIWTYGSRDRSSVPVLVAGLPPVVEVRAGDTFTCARLQDHTVKCWGNGYRHELGDGTSVPRATPAPVTGLSDAVALALGFEHDCALRRTGEIVCWGANTYGQLGTDDTEDRATPTPILDHAEALDAGAYHTCAPNWAAEGILYCWGRNNVGQLGDGTQEERHVATPVATGTGPAVQVVAGFWHTCARIDSGEVVCWGSNDSGQLGIGSAGVPETSPRGVVGLSETFGLDAGSGHTCALDGESHVACWGDNSRGQLGIGTMTSMSVPTRLSITNAADVSAGYNHTCVLKTDHTVACFGDNSYGQLGNGESGAESSPVAVAGYTGFAEIVAGANHTCSRNVLCWGENDAYQLGNGTRVDSATATRVEGVTGAIKLIATTYGTIAIRGAVSFWYWGWVPGTTMAPTPTAFTEFDPSVLELGAGLGSHLCGFNAAGEVYCVGVNGRGQIGDGTTVNADDPVRAGTLSGVARLAIGFEHTVAQLSDGHLYVWGYGLGGGLTGDITSPTEFALVSPLRGIHAGDKYTCMVSEGGAVACIGWNYYGQLGTGDNENRLSLTEIPGFGTVWTLCTGATHTCAVVEATGEVRCAGQNASGQLGDGTYDDANAPVTVAGLSPAFSVVCGWNHTCALLIDGTVACWGMNDSGQLGGGYFGYATEPDAVVGLPGG